MAKIKLKKCPKKPSQNASYEVLERWLAKVKEVAAYNAEQLKKEIKRRDLLKVVNGINVSDINKGVVKGIGKAKK